MSTSFFRHPLQTRYTTDAMKRLFSDDRRFETWHEIWIAIAKIEKDLGLAITDAQIMQMESARNLIDYEAAARFEQEFRHDVMAHLHAFAAHCPAARSIIHLGCTSCDVTDNADLITMREALDLTCVALAKVIERLKRFAYQYRSMPCLGYTHFQAAQLTTVGKRACLWLQDLLMNLAELERLHRELRFRGLKGATGTQASFLALFDHDKAKVMELDRRFAAAFGFTGLFAITGQTYPRQQDSAVLAALASLGASAHKMATDIRLLAHEKEVEEPFESRQVGSSAMAYKRNPMRSERVCGLARHLIGLAGDAYHTHATQWLERSLDDSAIRRIAIAEAFLTADAVLLLLQNVSEGLVIYPKVIATHIRAELPFMATENIIAAMVMRGADRQVVHENLRVLSLQAGVRVKQKGKDNNLLKLIREDPFFALIHAELDNLLDPATFIGRAPEQVQQFIDEEIQSALEAYQGKLEGTADLKV